MTLLKSIGAILIGLVTIFILALLTDLFFFWGVISSNIFPEAVLFLLMVIYRTLYAIFGGYITARLAPQKPMKHVMILGALLTLGRIVVAAAVIDMNTLPWYALGAAVVALPSVWIGGKLYK